MRSIRFTPVTVFLFVVFVPFAVAGAILSAGCYALLSPFMLLNFVFHRRAMKKLDAEGYDENETSMVEFGPRADVVGDILRTIPIFPLIPAICCWEEIAPDYQPTPPAS